MSEGAALSEQPLHSVVRLPRGGPRRGHHTQGHALGRYAAQSALAELTGDGINVNIRRGDFGQPLVVCDQPRHFALSISHLDTIAVAFCMESPCSIGIDLTDRREAADTARDIAVTCDEARVWRAGSLPQELMIDSIWTAKESLSKALGTGFYASVEALSFSEFTRDSELIHICTPRHFACFHCVTVHSDLFVLSLCVPHRFKADFQPLFRFAQCITQLAQPMPHIHVREEIRGKH